MARYNKLGLQILALLANGLLLGYSRRGRERRELMKESDKIWLSIDRNQLFHSMRFLKMNKLVDIFEESDGNKVRITGKGKILADAGIVYGLAVKKPRKWDGRWRLVIFDIPENRKKIRDAFRGHLKRLGFHEFQKSVFAIPYPCEDEITVLTNFHNLKDNVRYMEARLSYDNDLRKIFSI